MVIVRRAIPHHLCRRWSSNKGYLHGSASDPNHNGCYFSTDSSKETGSSAMKASTKIPKKANVVVVGGGIIGTSVAYHLAKFGVEDVVLLERDKLTSGTTWHAAGLINTFGSLSSTSTFMRKYSKELYSKVLQEETGMDTGYLPVGFIELACDTDRLQYYRRVASFNRFCGVQVEELTPSQVREKFPLLAIEESNVLAGFYVPTDGRVNPYDATMALAKGARLYGATILEDTPVTGITKSRTVSDESDILAALPRVTGVTLDSGDTIEANVVVNCAGMWARQFGAKCGVDSIPNQAAEHYYLLTDNMPEVDPTWPVVEDSSRCTYIRPEGGGLMLGFFEWEGAAWNARNDIPHDFSFGEIEPDWERMGPYVEKAMELVPSTMNVGIKNLFCGPESFTPDNNPIVGEAPELRNYFVAAGLNSVGILTGGGLGNLLARWIRDGSAPNDIDVTGINASRFHKYQSNIEYRELRSAEALTETYKVHYPDHMLSTCRGAKQSPFHDRLKLDAQAYFRDVSGWESPAWYAPMGEKAQVTKESFGRENWFPYWEAEHRACRENVALFDMSFMSKFMVQGNDAGAFLNRLSTANVNGESGEITYTQWLNESGYMEADLTVTKLEDDKFMVVATDTMHNHVLSHMRRRLSASQHVFISDVTGAYAQLNIQGPRSRELLQSLTYHDMSDFPFRKAEDIDIGLARALCMRITYVGELGYELFIPAEQALHVYDRIIEKGKEFNLQHAGLRALGSLRMEKAYRDYGHDIDNTDTILECGLGFTCDFEKAQGFIGMEHVLEQSAKAKADGGLPKRMAQVFLHEHEEPLLHHGEIIYRNGEAVSDVRSASYGHTLGGAVGLTMLERQNTNGPITKKTIQEGTWEVKIGNEMYPCTISLAPLYDPKSLRIKV